MRRGKALASRGKEGGESEGRHSLTHRNPISGPGFASIPHNGVNSSPPPFTPANPPPSVHTCASRYGAKSVAMR